ncbi:Integrase catalytic domain-containing protein [Abeliophyllum distichum]|uniref:Integrase catalytic domain-containing protein n=1 Tax=Abeliophyllum distichum TaxID=126358 RepID=A0ABD1RVN0_9LAMI
MKLLSKCGMVCLLITLPRTIGCIAYSHQNEDKLEPRAQKCVFLGYSQGVKWYRLWARGQGGVEVIIRRDVVFNESDMPCLDSKTVEVISEKTKDFFLTLVDKDLNKPEPHTIVDVESKNHQTWTDFERTDEPQIDPQID